MKQQSLIFLKAIFKDDYRLGGSTTAASVVAVALFYTVL